MTPIRVATALGTGLLCTANHAYGQNAEILCPDADAVVLQANNFPDDFNHPGPNYNLFDSTQSEDNAIYYSAGDWVRDPSSSLFIDGLVDDVGSFGMVIGNYGGDYPEGFDRQVKHIQEYLLAPAYTSGLNAGTLESATLTFVVDRVVDMSLSGCTDCVAPEWLYINVFGGDGKLTSVADAQLDFDRCDRLFPETWDIVVHLLSPDGFRLSDDEIDLFGGTITFEIDVTSEVRALMASGEAAAGFTFATSHDGDFTLMSIDGGSYPVTQLPTLTLEGNCGLATPPSLDPPVPSALIPSFVPPVPFASIEFGSFDMIERASRLGAASELGDLNRDGEVGQADWTYFIRSFTLSRRGKSVDQGQADLNGDGVIDSSDITLFIGLFVE